ncbi:FxLYD domain-containing protein [Paenibacillus sp. 1P07SE]|uniref:FxLYD domain-containing protein n=1 Tax=Paenibacillus sp. 1P07SE TaxID=3132209 RepID=UPI0039A40DE5
MYCSQCGKKVPPESRFCPHCGAARDAADIRARKQDAGAAASASNHTPPTERASVSEDAGQPVNPGSTGATAQEADTGLEVQSVDGEVRLDPVQTDAPAMEQAAGREDASDKTDEPAMEPADGREGAAGATDGTAAAGDAEVVPSTPGSHTPDMTDTPGPHPEDVRNTPGPYPDEATDISDPDAGEAPVQSDDSTGFGHQDVKDAAVRPDDPASVEPGDPADAVQSAPDTAHEAAVPAPDNRTEERIARTGPKDLRGGFSRPPAGPARTDDHREPKETVIIAHPAQNDTPAGTDRVGTTGAVQSADGAAPPPAPRRKTFHLLWIAPLVCLLLVGAAVAALYVYHDQQHREIRDLLAEGEELALAHQLPEGLARIEQALVKRPSHPALLEHQTVLEDAIALQETVAAARSHMEEERYEEAGDAIADVKTQLQWRSGPVYEQLHEEIQRLEQASVFAGARAELAARSTVTELIPLMNRLRSYEGEEAETFREEIREKAVELAQEAAAAHLATGDFPSALSVVDEALSLAPDNGDLTALKAEIEAEQAEAAAQAASEQAKQDQQQNAVEILEFQVQLDDQGRFHIQGILKNVSSYTLQSLVIYYDIYDQEDRLLGQHTTNVSPQTVAPGAEAGFQASHEDGENMFRALVTRWTGRTTN